MVLRVFQIVALTWLYFQQCSVFCPQQAAVCLRIVKSDIMELGELTTTSLSMESIAQSVVRVGVEGTVKVSKSWFNVVSKARCVANDGTMFTLAFVLSRKNQYLSDEVGLFVHVVLDNYFHNLMKEECSSFYNTKQAVNVCKLDIVCYCDWGWCIFITTTFVLLYIKYLNHLAVMNTSKDI